MIVFIGWTSDYDKLMIKNLKEKSAFIVKEINFPEGKIIYKLNKIFKYNLMRVYLLVNSFFISNEDFVIFKDSDGYGYLKFTRYLKGQKVLLIRNIVNEHKMNGYKKIFTEIYSFDKNQCGQYNIKHMPQLSPFEHVTANSTVTESCYFIGLDKKRANKICCIGTILERYGIATDFSIVRDETSVKISKYHVKKSITYNNNIKKVLSSRFLLEVLQPGQTGLTLRALESVFFNKKLISDNVALYEHELYDESRMFIFDQLDFFKHEKFRAFINSQYLPVPDDILNNYRASTFFERITNARK